MQTRNNHNDMVAAAVDLFDLNGVTSTLTGGRVLVRAGSGLKGSVGGEGNSFGEGRGDGTGDLEIWKRPGRRTSGCRGCWAGVTTRACCPRC